MTTRIKFTVDVELSTEDPSAKDRIGRKIHEAIIDDEMVVDLEINSPPEDCCDPT